MRRQNTLSRRHFERLFDNSGDPWNFSESEYEQAKYQATLAAIGDGYRSALEVGCSIGVFTRLLAARCSRLIAIDIAETALQAARKRCSDLPQVEFRRMALPRQLPSGDFDLIVLSEVGYYWTLDNLDRFVAWVLESLVSGGVFAFVHWTGETDYPLTGDQVHDRILDVTRGSLRSRANARHQSYRLDVLTKV
jgi:SAM-dependent methyltransferase